MKWKAFSIFFRVHKQLANTRDFEVNVPTAERDRRGRQSLVVGQRDHLRHSQAEPDGADEQVTLPRLQLGPVVPVVRLVVGRVHDAADSFHNRTRARATVATFIGCQLRFSTNVGRCRVLVKTFLLM